MNLVVLVWLNARVVDLEVFLLFFKLLLDILVMLDQGFSVFFYNQTIMYPLFDFLFYFVPMEDSHKHLANSIFPEWSLDPNNSFLLSDCEIGKLRDIKQRWMIFSFDFFIEKCFGGFFMDQELFNHREFGFAQWLIGNQIIQHFLAV